MSLLYPFVASVLACAPADQAVSCPLPLDVCVPAEHTADPKLRKALANWVKAYRKGEFDFRRKRLAKTSIGVKSGVISRLEAGQVGHGREIEALCEAVSRSDDADSAASLLAVCGIGLDPKNELDPEIMPVYVRRCGERFIDKLKSPEALNLIQTVAKAKEATKAREVAEQAAALRALGRRKDESHRPVFEGALGFNGFALRLAAVDAIKASELKTGVPPLIAHVSVEKDERVLIGAFDAMLRIVRVHKAGVGEDALRRAADSAMDSLGRCTWRADLIAVEFLEVVRSEQSVPALIGVLERFSLKSKADPKLKSGTLLRRTHDALVSLTGAVFAAEQPEKWRSWWDEAQDSFTVVPVADIQKKLRGVKGGTGTGEFFGIPIRGSRVVFIVDLSGSMNFPMSAGATSTERGVPSGDGANVKLDIAKRQLIKAVSKLTKDCEVNLVQFNMNAKAWQPKLQKASKRTRSKFEKYVTGFRADGGTNLWSGLKEALKIEAFAYGDRYASDIDELFILSDGIPTVGDIIDPLRILELVRESNRYARVKINTVFLKSDNPRDRQDEERAGMSGSEFMKRLARDNGGKFIEM